MVAHPRDRKKRTGYRAMLLVPAQHPHFFLLSFASHCISSPHVIAVHVCHHIRNMCVCILCMYVLYIYICIYIYDHIGSILYTYTHVRAREAVQALQDACLFPLEISLFHFPSLLLVSIFRPSVSLPDDIPRENAPSSSHPRRVVPSPPVSRSTLSRRMSFSNRFKAPVTSS